MVNNMCKYDLLWKYLKNNNKDYYKLSFDKINSILKFNLNHSFLNSKKELKKYGYEVGKVSLKEKTIIFNKIK